MEISSKVMIKYTINDALSNSFNDSLTFIILSCTTGDK